MDIDDLIHIYVTGCSADDLRDLVADSGYRSIMSELHKNQGLIASGGGGGSHDAMMVALADRMPGRYAPKIIDTIKAGFSELYRANPLRYEVVIYDYTDRRGRAQKAEALGITEIKFKNELRTGREYLGVRFIDLLLPQK
jgi:hypothetical protein